MATDFGINLETYTYLLPEERIATHGLVNRDQSKLLTYANGEITDRKFNELKEVIPKNTTLFFNNTKVIQARLKFQRSTGATIEIFLLNPIEPIDISQALAATSTTQWHCMVGNLKKWKEGELLTQEVDINDQSLGLEARLLNKDQKIVEFDWPTGANISFGTIIDKAGNTPLPPYIKRKAEKIDKNRYQTVYSQLSGAVAAPTAGLHFTPELIKELAARGVKEEYLTLHVGAGTFQPIQTATVADHPMHNEKLLVTTGHIKSILAAKFIIPVGTTSMRTLESLYWFGQLLSHDPEADFKIKKLYPYEQHNPLLSRHEALMEVLNYMERNNLEQLIGETEIFIFPGYSFKICDGLITNFHQPGSTLILLVAAFVGDDWRKIYQHALAEDYRFLSYGDSSILLP